MAGQRRPGSWGVGNDAPIDDGTTCLGASPAPGPIGVDGQSSVPRSSRSSAAFTSFAGSASTNFDALSRAVADVQRSDGWTRLQPLVVSLLGPQTFGLGVVYGMGENLVGGVVGLAQLAKIFLLADLYDRAHQPALMAVGPLGPFQRVLAEVSMRTFRQELEAAHAERDALLAELKYVVTHPVEVLGNIGADYAGKWRRFEELSTQQTLSGQFEAGRIVGEVLLDVLTLIGGGAAAVKAAAGIPKLTRLARLQLPARSAAPASRAAGTGAARAIPVTPRHLRTTTPVAETIHEGRVRPQGCVRTGS